MEIKTILKSITEELAQCYSLMDEEQIQELERRVKKANRIYVAGAGRSLLMIRGFAMRLMHMGFISYVVGETVTLAIAPGDLLIIASGSGSTGTLTSIATKCKKIGADLALITAAPNSIIGNMADHIVEIPTYTCKMEGEPKRESVQLGGNTFEQSVLLVCDAIIIDIVNNMSLEESNTTLMRRHAKLE